MTAPFLLVLLLLLAMMTAPAVAIFGTVDALRQPAEVWSLAGQRRRMWVWQAVGAVCLPVALAYSGFYFARVRPRLMRARGQLALQDVPEFSAAPAPVPDDVSVRIRIPLAWRILMVVAVAVPFSLSVVWSGGRELPFAATYLAVLVVLNVTVQRSFGITLTPAMAVVHGLRRRRIPWDAVGSVAVEQNFGGGRVVLWTLDGRRFALRAPVLAFPGIGRARFEREFHVIGQWWLRHRGTALPAADA